MINLNFACSRFGYYELTLQRNIFVDLHPKSVYASK